MTQKKIEGIDPSIENRFQPTTDLVTAAAIHTIAAVTGEKPGAITARILRKWAHDGDFAAELASLNSVTSMIQPANKE